MPIDTLMTAATIAVGIAGFMAVAVALGKIGTQDAVGRFVFAVLFSVPFAALFLALLPVVLVHLTLTDDLALRISSLSMAAFSVGWTYKMCSRARSVSVPLRSRANALLGTVGTANIVAQLLNGWWLPEKLRFGVYFAGVVWYLVFAAFALFLSVQEQVT